MKCSGVLSNNVYFGWLFKTQREEKNKMYSSQWGNNTPWLIYLKAKSPIRAHLSGLKSWEERVEFIRHRVYAGLGIFQVEQKCNLHKDLQTWLEGAYRMCLTSTIRTYRNSFISWRGRNFWIFWACSSFSFGVSVDIILPLSPKFVTHSVWTKEMTLVSTLFSKNLKDRQTKMPLWKAEAELVMIQPTHPLQEP